MPKLQFTTLIHAPIQRVFDLSRCVSLHKRHFEKHAIVPVRGKFSGLLDLKDQVVWNGKMGRKVRQIDVEVTNLRAPEYLKFEFLKEPFEHFIHEVFLTEIDNGTILMDQIDFNLPTRAFSPFMNNKCAEGLITGLLKERNALCKQYAEGNKWHAILP